MSEIFASSGILHYSIDGGYRLVIDVDKSIAAYYRALLPKEWGVVGGRHPAHITVVRCYAETPTNLAAWGKHEGERVEFFYESGLRWDESYYWLRVLSKRIEELRIELGLSVERKPGWSVPPPGFSKYFHLTVGNSKLI